MMVRRKEGRNVVISSLVIFLLRMITILTPLPGSEGSLATRVQWVMRKRVRSSLSFICRCLGIKVTVARLRVSIVISIEQTCDITKGTKKEYMLTCVSNG